MMNDNAKIHNGKAIAEGVNDLYAAGQTDYYLEPIIACDHNNTPIGRIQDGDLVVFCCRRGEREIQLTEAFTDPGFDKFERKSYEHLLFVILTLYHEKFKDLPVAFAPSHITETLGEVVSRSGLSQLRTSESEKFAHITFFLNGGNNKQFDSEEAVRIPSPKGIPFDQIPELSLAAVSDQVLKGINEKKDLIITNIANGDVIGHTSNNKAKIKCAEYVDRYLKVIVNEAIQEGYVILITADHGNLEVMTADDGSPHVSHTTNLVPAILIDPLCKKACKLNDGKLADIAPTVLQILNIQQPPIMDGISLAQVHDFGKGRKVLLVILDGWGISSNPLDNPIEIASTPFWDNLLIKFPHSKLFASGEFVGLKEGKAGNSEAGHMNIGAGRIVLQDDMRLDMAMKDNTFYKNEVILRTIQNVKNRKSSLHLIGLLTEKSSHGSIDYPLAILKMAKEHGVSDVFLHMIFDGRSTAPGSAPALLEKLDTLMSKIGIGQIVTGIGRGIALDRDGNYTKTQRAYDALVSGTGKCVQP